MTFIKAKTGHHQQLHKGGGPHDGRRQRQAADIFGGGVNAFSRYETGRTKPPLALVKLLRVLEKHPELLDEIR